MTPLREEGVTGHRERRERLKALAGVDCLICRHDVEAHQEKATRFRGRHPCRLHNCPCQSFSGRLDYASALALKYTRLRRLENAEEGSDVDD